MNVLEFREAHGGDVQGAERVSLRDRYGDGDCVPFAFAVHWMTGWPMQALSEKGGDRHLHFAAVSPDGMAWDSTGPRTLSDAGLGYADDPVWEGVDPLQTVMSHPGGIAEDEITEACVAAINLFGRQFDAFVTRLPRMQGPQAPAP